MDCFTTLAMTSPIFTRFCKNWSNPKCNF